MTTVLPVESGEMSRIERGGANSEGSRYLGMIEHSHLADAILDPNTVTVAIADSAVPALVPVRYAEGYDVVRCHEIVGEEDPSRVLYYSLPAGLGGAALAAEFGRKLVDKPFGYVFYDVTQVDQIPQPLIDSFKASGHVVEGVPLLDIQAEEGNQQASISLYGFDVPSENPEVHTKNPSIGELYELYREGVAQGKYEYNVENGNAILSGNGISDTLFEDLWALYQDRFSWLGEKHPVSMEDTKEQFASALRSEHTLSSIRFENGKPVCFTYFAGQENMPYWLNGAFLNDKQKMHMSDKQDMLFFPGIVADAKGSGYSMPVIGLLANVIMDTNANYRIVFENTNRSERYIPRLVRTIINSLGRVEVQTPELLDRTVYGCIRFSRPESVDE